MFKLDYLLLDVWDKYDWNHMVICTIELMKLNAYVHVYTIGVKEEGSSNKGNTHSKLKGAE